MAKAILAEFPDRPSLQLGRILYERGKADGVFRDAKHACDTVRYYRGARGAHNRKWVAPKEHLRALQEPHDPWNDIPEGEKQLNWEPLQLQEQRTLILSDIHFPFHWRDALLPALEYGRQAEVDGILLNGDQHDCYEVSKFDRDCSKDKLVLGLSVTWGFLRTLRREFPKAKIRVRVGNHEERWSHYFWRKAPEVCGLAFAQWSYAMTHPEVWGGPEDVDLGVEYIDERRPLAVGHLWILHGHELPGGAYSPVSAARGAQMKTLLCTMLGHRHQTSEHSETNAAGRVVASWSVGCLCDLHPTYSPINPRWNHGFAVTERIDDEQFRVDNRKVIKGKVY